MTFILVKTEQAAYKCINKSVYSPYNQNSLVSYLQNSLYVYIRIYIDHGSCSQLAAMLHRHISTEAWCGQSNCLTARFAFGVNACILK